MSDLDQTGGEHRRPWRALWATLLVQSLASLCMATAPVLAPAVAPLLGVAPQRVGLFVAVCYLCAMAAGLRAGIWAGRLGPLRLSQIALLFCMAGLLAGASGTIAWLLPAAVLIGVGYGIVNPAAAGALSHHAPTDARGLFFSIKQTGVPIGVALAGLTLPASLGWLGWQATLLLAAGICLAAALVLLGSVRALDAPVARAAMATPASPRASTTSLAAHAARPSADRPLAAVWAHRPIRRLSIVSLVYAMTQQCFLTFAVSWVCIDLGWPLAQAAALFAGSQALAIAARVGFGHLADRRVVPARLLGALGLLMALACVGIALVPAQAPAWLVGAAMFACASTALGWNGAFFAELARLSPPGEMARLSGATQVFTFAGGLIGPLLFGEFARLAGHHAVIYAGLALLPATSGLLMLRAARATPVAGAQA